MPPRKKERNHHLKQMIRDYAQQNVRPADENNELDIYKEHTMIDLSKNRADVMFLERASTLSRGRARDVVAEPGGDGARLAPRISPHTVRLVHTQEGGSEEAVCAGAIRRGDRGLQERDARVHGRGRGAALAGVHQRHLPRDRNIGSPTDDGPRRLRKQYCPVLFEARQADRGQFTTMRFCDSTED